MDQTTAHRPSIATAEHVALDQSPSEHIQLASEDAELREPKVVRERWLLRDRWHGRALELTLFAEDLLTVARLGRKQAEKAQLIDLRYLDPEPAVETRVAKRSLRLTAVLGAVTGGTAALASTLEPAAWLFPWMLVPAAAASLTLAAAVYGSYRDYNFVTRHGRARVLKLRARLGGLRHFRAAAEALTKAARDADVDAAEVNTSCLKREMQEHYRLQSAGLISRDQCASSRLRILALYG